MTGPTRPPVPAMECFPAIDLRSGGAVRLVQGDYGRQQDYGDPLAIARRYAAAGARWIHVVDLDAARGAGPVNRSIVAEIARAVDVPVQHGGGIRSAEDVAACLEQGISRVVLGTAAVRDPKLVEELAKRYPGAVAVGLDHRGGGADVAVSGWEQRGGVSLAEILERFEPVPLAALVVTAIERDGTLGGPDTEGLRRVLGATSHPVIASGGVRDVADLRELAALESAGRQLAGAIVGKALLDGTLDVGEAVAACVRCG